MPIANKPMSPRDTHASDDATVSSKGESIDAFVQATGRAAADAADRISDRLKSVGVDTDVMAPAAKEQASELQRLIGEELKARPMRALAAAAASGLLLGLLIRR